MPENSNILDLDDNTPTNVNLSVPNTIATNTNDTVTILKHTSVATPTPKTPELKEILHTILTPNSKQSEETPSSSKSADLPPMNNNQNSEETAVQIPLQYIVDAAPLISLLVSKTIF